MYQIVDFLQLIDEAIWGHFLIGFLVLLGVFLTVRLRGLQFRYLGYALKLAFTRSDEEAEGDISQFQALMTALAATIGIGSIAGVATAIAIGGFGAIFWMWVIALFGMATKYVEALLAVKYRIVDHRGEMSGGPMYYIARGMGKKWRWLAAMFALAATLASFAGGNMVQANSIADAMRNLTGLSPVWTGLILVVLTGTVLLGGIGSIGRVCALLVPVMAAMYIISGLVILVMHAEAIPRSLALIVTSAFKGQAATGGFLGASVALALQYGVARGISSNEAGLGSGPIAAAAAKTDLPGRQAMISMTTVFLSTFIVCTITALVIAVTGVLGELDQAGRPLNGAPLVMEAFSRTIPYGASMITVGLVLFGYSTIIGWAYYGERSVEYLLGERAILYFRILFSCVVFVGAILSLDVVWPLTDIMNGFMTFPNLIGLLVLSGVAVKESRTFFRLIQKEKSEKKRTRT